MKKTVIYILIAFIGMLSFQSQADLVKLDAASNKSAAFQTVKKHHRKHKPVAVRHRHHRHHKKHAKKTN
jgi:hypothetical protein